VACAQRGEEARRVKKRIRMINTTGMLFFNCKYPSVT
jgi:hypothetical protein